VTLHFMTEKPDAGDIVGQAAVPIAFDDTALTLFGKMEDAASRLLADLLPRIANGRSRGARTTLPAGATSAAQARDGGSTGPARRWRSTTSSARSPVPTRAYSELAGEKLTVWWAIPLPAEAGERAVSGDDPDFRRTVLRDGRGMRRPGFQPAAGRRRDGGRVASTEEIEWRTRATKGEAIVGLLAGAANGRLS